MHITISIYPVSLNLFIGKLLAENRPSLSRREFEKKIEELKPLVYQSQSTNELERTNESTDVSDEGTRRIKALIVLNRTSVSEIARKVGVTRQWVSQVVNGHKPSKRIRKAIAQAVGKPVEELWPDNHRAA